MKWDPDDYANQSSAQFAWAQELISRLALSGSEAVLDVGCGDGKITAALATALPNGYVLGVDSSAEFITYASEHYPLAEFPSLHFQRMDARSLNCGRQFDRIFSNAALHWVDDHLSFLQGASHHLRGGGKLVTSCGGAGNASAIIATLHELQSSAPWQRYFDGFTFPYYFHSPAEYAPWLAKTGLVATRCDLVEKDMVHDDPDGLAGWVRTTWMPYTQRLPEQLRESFIAEFVSRYLQHTPLDSFGRSHVRMVRLEVEATKEP